MNNPYSKDPFYPKGSSPYLKGPFPSSPIRVIASPQDLVVQLDPRVRYVRSPIKGARYVVRAEPPKPRKGSK